MMFCSPRLETPLRIGVYECGPRSSFWRKDTDVRNSPSIGPQVARIPSPSQPASCWIWQRIPSGVAPSGERFVDSTAAHSPCYPRNEYAVLSYTCEAPLTLLESDLLYLHRSFFARAVTDHSKDPLGSPYGTSVIAAYRSAGSLVALMRNLHTQLKEPSERMWFLWTHMFSCAVRTPVKFRDRRSADKSFAMRIVDCVGFCRHPMSIDEFGTLCTRPVGLRL